MTYRRTTTVPERQHEAITRAYKAAGVTPPNVRAVALDAISAEPGAIAVANELAREAHTADDAERFMENALERLARAQAADALRTALAQVEPQVRRQKMPTTLACAAADLGRAFTATVKELTAAAGKTA
jgi:aromatic ring hydroxylase